MFITKKKHNAIITQLGEHNESLKGCIRSLTKERLENKTEIMRLKNRLSNAVEGFDRNEIKILKARQQGDYIYTVTCGEDVKTVRVPMSSKNFNRAAKKAAGYGRKDKCKVARWVL